MELIDSIVHAADSQQEATHRNRMHRFRNMSMPDKMQLQHDCMDSFVSSAQQCTIFQISNLFEFKFANIVIYCFSSITSAVSTRICSESQLASLMGLQNSEKNSNSTAFRGKLTTVRLDYLHSDSVSVTIFRWSIWDLGLRHLLQTDIETDTNRTILGSKIFKMLDAYWTNFESSFQFLRPIGIVHLKSNSAMLQFQIFGC